MERAVDLGARTRSDLFRTALRRWLHDRMLPPTVLVGQPTGVQMPEILALEAARCFLQPARPARLQ